jgi:hypothetical protein
MQCLVCTGEARDLTPENFDGHVIGCPGCGNYEIAGSAWDRFRNASQQARTAALGKAVAQRRRQMANDQKHLLLIVSYALDPLESDVAAGPRVDTRAFQPPLTRVESLSGKRDDEGRLVAFPPEDRRAPRKNVNQYQISATGTAMS